MGDLAAIGKSSSAILSALSDPVEGRESLEQRLEDALESASVHMQRGLSYAEALKVPQKKIAWKR